MKKCLKSSLKVSFLCLLALLPLLTAKSAEINRKSIDLYLDLDSGELRLEEAALISSPAPRPSYLKAGYKIEIRSAENEILYQSYFRDPGAVFTISWIPPPWL